MAHRPKRRRTAEEKRAAIHASEKEAMAAALPAYKRREDGRHRLGYARVSMDDQTNARQIAALVEAGVHPDDIFTDTASGANMERPGWETCWRDIHEGDILVVKSIDRLGRSLGQLAMTLEALHQKGADLHVIEMPVDFRTPIGKFIYSMLAGFADFERLYINERTMDGLKRARERGIFGGTKAKHTDEAILEFYEKFGATHGAEKAGMSRGGFLKALKRAQDKLQEKEITSAKRR